MSDDVPRIDDHTGEVSTPLDSHDLHRLTGRLCAALNLDPTTGEPATPPAPTGHAALAAMLQEAVELLDIEDRNIGVTLLDLITEARQLIDVVRAALDPGATR